MYVAYNYFNRYNILVKFSIDSVLISEATFNCLLLEYIMPIRKHLDFYLKANYHKTIFGL